MIPFSMSSFASASVCARLDTRNSSSVTVVSTWAILTSQGEIVLLYANRFVNYNALDAARAIKKDQRTAHIPIVGWSAYFGELWREEALRAGMVAYMEKPLSAPVIEATIKKFT